MLDDIYFMKQALIEAGKAAVKINNKLYSIFFIV